MRPRSIQKILTDRLGQWLDERLQLNSLINFLRNKSIPIHKHSIWYLFGGITLFFFIVQIISGILLLIYYKPTPETAYESVKFILEEVSYGRFIRSIHIWSSHLMIAAISIHMFSVYFMKAYRRPREAMWLSGFLLMALTLGFGFTGYLLPWDMTAFFATQIGTEIPRSIPLIGDFIVLLLRGGTEVNGETLTRLFALHVVILPLMALVLLGIHLILNQVLGTSKPIGLKDKEPSIPFLPSFILRDWMSWLLLSVLLIALATTFPQGLGPKADPFASAPTGIRPEWYFWFLFQTLRIVPAQVFSFSGELILNIALLVAGVAWWMVPFLDKRARDEKTSPVFTLVGILLAVCLVGLTLLAAM